MTARAPLLVFLSLCLFGCRADESTCSELGSHIAALAEAEGKAGAGTAVAVERDCNEHRPTQKLVRCLRAAQSLADVEAC
jgi:hypothetical protein